MPGLITQVCLKGRSRGATVTAIFFRANLACATKGIFKLLFKHYLIFLDLGDLVIINRA